MLLSDALYPILLFTFNFYNFISFINIIDWITEIIKHSGYYGIFLVSFIETIFPPIPSEFVFPFAGMVAQQQNLGLIYAVALGIAGGLGSTAGAIIIYLVSFKFGRPAILKWGRYVLVDESKLNKAETWFNNHGRLLILLGRLSPGLREIVSVPAGLTKMNFFQFFVFTLTGSLIWSIALTMIGYHLGPLWNTVYKDWSKFFNIAGIIIIAVFIGFFCYGYYKQFKLKPSKHTN